MSEPFVHAAPGTAERPALVTVAPGPQVDAFERLRISDPVELFTANFIHGTASDLVSSATVGTGAVARDADAVSMLLSVATTSDVAVLQSRWCIPYLPGKSQLVMITGNLGGAEAGTTKEVGIYDDEDGVLLRLEGDGTASFVIRSKVSGVVTERVVPQSHWNTDTLDGDDDSPSGIVLDLATQQVLVIDYGWLGSAEVRVGFLIGGSIRIAHCFRNSNTIDGPWCRSGALPIRGRIEADAAASGSMRITCASVQSEGGFRVVGINASGDNGTTGRSIAATGTLPLVSVRVSSTSPRVAFEPIGLQVLPTTPGDVVFRASLVVGGQLTNASWSALSNHTEIDTSATAITGGVEVWSGYGRASTQGIAQAVTEIAADLRSDLLVGVDVAGVATALSLVVTVFAGSDTESYVGKIGIRIFA